MKKKSKGTWKIAYADFVTAMMILFLMLWIMAAIPKEELEEIAKYFNKPTKEPTISSELSNLGTKRPHLIESQDNVLLSEQSLNKTLREIEASNSTSKEKAIFTNVLQTIKNSDSLREFSDNINVYWNDGLVIEVVDSYSRPLFKDLTSEISIYALPMLRKLCSLLQNQNNYMVIDGHATLIKNSQIDPWLLSFSRPNKIREYLNKYIADSSIIKVNANSDKDLMYPNDRSNPNNMRITITLLNKSSLKKNHKIIPETINLN